MMRQSQDLTKNKPHTYVICYDETESRCDVSL